MKSFFTLTLAILLAVAANAQYKFGTVDMNGVYKSSFENFGYMLMNGKIALIAKEKAGVGYCPWISDGTTAGTTLITRPNSSYGVIGSFASLNVNGTPSFFFSFCRIISSYADCNPWISDGTTAGTQKLNASVAVNNFVPKSIKNKIYFTGTDTAHGRELWCTDGTTAGTTLLKDINPGKSDGALKILAVDTNRVFFSATDGTNGVELWCTDGTATGTYMVKNITAGAGSSSFPDICTLMNGVLIFWMYEPTSGSELWRSDGTAAGTNILKDIMPGNASSGPNQLAVKGNTTYFSANDGIHGRELWITDGTTSGTRMVKDINTSSVYSKTSSNPSYITVYNNEVYFNADDSLHGRELWKSDGEANGTKMVIDICKEWHSDPRYLYVYDSLLFFTADNPCKNGEPTYRELYYTDGTGKGTVMIKPSTAKINGGASTITNFITYKDKLFFNGEYWGSDDLWYLGDSALVSTGIENINTPHITLYPNPAHHNFTIKTTTAFKTGSVTLTDITGRVVKTEKLYNNEQTISLQGIAPGMYMADVWLDDRRTTQKLIIE